MGYLFLALSNLAGATKGFCGKKTSGAVTEYKDAVLVNFLRMALCIVIGFALLAFQGDLALLRPEGPTLLISALSGVANAFFVVLWLLSVRKGAYMLVEVFGMCGVLIPLLLTTFLGEAITLKDLAGLALLVLSSGIMCSYNNGIQKKLTPSVFLLLAACGAASGLADFTQKLFVHQVPYSTSAVFNLYTYIFSAVTLIILYLFSVRQAHIKGETTPSVWPILKKIAGYVTVMALCLYLNTFFKTEAAALLPAAQLYPLSKGIALILSSLMAAVFFHEKLTFKAILGIGISFVGILVMNVL